MFDIFYNVRIINLLLLVNTLISSEATWAIEDDEDNPTTTTKPEAIWAIEDDICETPKGVNSNCIFFDDCQPLKDIIYKLSNLKRISLLQAYYCASDGRKQKFCCPSDSSSLLDNTNSVTDNDLPDVEKHKNIGLLPKECGPIQVAKRIINGKKARLMEFPWMALLSYRTQFGPAFKCGGTIINKNYILTAAHCIYNPPYPLIGIRIGEHNIDTVVDCEYNDDLEEHCLPPFIDLAIEKRIPHPEYNTTTLYGNDIGLLRVRAISFEQDYIKPVCLPVGTARDYNLTNRYGVVTGWGITETGKTSSELLKVYIKTVPVDECQKIYESSSIPVTSKQLCAGGANNSDSCFGDSGGPFQIHARLYGSGRVVQYGIVSSGPRLCGRNGLPGIYTKVAPYMNWILNTIKE